MDAQTRQQQIAGHLDAAAKLQAEVNVEAAPDAKWPPEGYYLVWHVLVGMMLGFIGAGVSLLVNTIGAPLAGEHPLQLVRVYLTFPMGEQALTATDGKVLTVGCMLYLITGGLYGIAFHLLMSTRLAGASVGKRFLVGSAMGLAVWVINFYLILSWLQPLMLGGNWIVSQVPMWVAAVTHLVFAWTILAVESVGKFDPRVHRTASIGFAVLLLTVSGGCGDQAQSNAGKSVYEGNQWAVVQPGEQVNYNQRQSLLIHGKRVYDMYCVGCHGEKGDGKGEAAVRLITQPRDFTKGIYKFRSTDSSSLPMEADLHRTITRGLSSVSMPSFSLMPEPDKVAVIQYIKAFYDQWDVLAPQRKLVDVPRPPADLFDASRAVRGGLVYAAAKCAACHGTDGAGKGATQVQYIDVWGNTQRPFNFTRGRLKGGDDPQDVYRTFHTGLRSIMPAYGSDAVVAINQQLVAGGLSDQQQAELADVIATFPVDFEAAEALVGVARRQLVERNSWDLVAYVLSLRGGTEATQ